MSPASQWTAAVAAIWACAFVLVPASLLVLSRTRPETVWDHARQYGRGIQGADSWKPMEIARRHAADSRERLYEEVFFEQRVKFQYPPSALLFIGGMQRPQLNRLSWWATLGTAVLTGATLHRSLHIQGVPAPGWLVLVGGGMALTFYPLLKAYTLGQIQTWIDFLLAAAIAAWVWKRPATSGTALGLACLIKPTYAVLLLWLVVRAEWRALTAAAAVVAVGLGVSITVYGLANHLSYLDVLSYIGARGESFHANQSFNGLLNRSLFNGPNLDWSDESFAPYHPVVFAITSGLFISLTVAAFIVPARSGAGGSAADLGLLLLSITIAAPVAWEHHYGILLPVLAAAAPVAVRRRVLGRWTIPWLVTAVIVSASYLQFTQRLAGTSLNVLQAYLLGAALMILILVYASLREPARARTP